MPTLLATGLLLVTMGIGAAAPRAAASTPAVLATGSARSVPVQVYLTEPDLSQAALTEEPDLTLTPQPLGSAVGVLTINEQSVDQQVIGFGAAMTDSSAWLIEDNLAPASRAALMQQLFTQDGIDLNFIRVPMGASDFSARGTPYTYDDLPEGQTDPGLANFSVGHDTAYILPALQQMMALNPAVDIISTEWSAPAWMKANDALDNLGGAGELLPADYAVLAQYFVDFVTAYESAGIPIWAVTPENEPGVTQSYPSMDLTPAAETTFIAQYLAPALARADLGTLIFSGDIGTRSAAFSTAVQQTPQAAADVAGAAWHCYGGQQGITSFHQEYPSVQNIMTECSPGIIPYSAGEAGIDALRNWASTVTLWNIALDPSGGPVQAPDSGCPHCTGLVTIDESARSVSLGLNYYQLGQLSKFIERGAVVVQTPRWVGDQQTSDTYSVSAGLDNVAVVNPDGTRVLVAYNHSSAPISFGVSWDGLGFEYTLGPAAMVTFRWPGPSTSGSGAMTVPGGAGAMTTSAVPPTSPTTATTSPAGSVTSPAPSGAPTPAQPGPAAPANASAASLHAGQSQSSRVTRGRFRLTGGRLSLTVRIEATRGAAGIASVRILLPHGVRWSHHLAQALSVTAGPFHRRVTRDVLVLTFPRPVKSIRMVASSEAFSLTGSGPPRPAASRRRATATVTTTEDLRRG